MPATPANTETRISAERVRQHLQGRFNPIRSLTPETLTTRLDLFDLGYLRDAALTWQKIRDRDDTVKTVTAKRELDCALLDWEILSIDDSPEALKHKQALEEFYNNLTATHALDGNVRGGVSCLVEQMMHSTGHKYAVHEIVWQPASGSLTAEFRFVPLQFFENCTGRLRYLTQDHTTSGVDLEEGGWMVTVGPGLMEATSIAYLFKQLPLRDWLLFCEKAGVPGLHGKTDAVPGSEDWDTFRDALANFSTDWALVTSRNAEVATIDLKASGQLPQPLLVDRMDRAISRLWRGADLGTMSQAGEAVGSNPQQSETEILAAADALRISETLQQYVDRMVVRYRFGSDTPKAYFQLKPKVRIDYALELKIDEALLSWGVPRGKRDLLEKYGRAEPDAGDELATAPAKPTMPFGNERRDADAFAAGNAALFRQRSLALLTQAERVGLAPLIERIDRLATVPAAEYPGELRRLQADLPQLSAKVLANPAMAEAWERILAPAALTGAAKAIDLKTAAK